MSIMLGNLSINDMENRLDVVFPEELKYYMKDKRQLNASNVKKGEWHCFDIPFMIHCGDIDTAKEILKYLKPLSSDMKETFQISHN